MFALQPLNKVNPKQHVFTLQKDLQLCGPHKKYNITNTLTFRSPDEPNGQEVLQVVEQNIFDLEVFLYLDSARTAGRHDEPWPVQTDTGQPEKDEG